MSRGGSLQRFDSRQLKRKYAIMNMIRKLQKKKRIEWIVEAWDDIKVITKEIVYNSFRYKGC